MVAPVVAILTVSARPLAEAIARVIGGTVHDASSPGLGGDSGFRAALQDYFRAGRPIIGLCASGILVRCLAPLLADKHDEPPVIAVAEDGSSAVPLLGGHRGANALARKIAAATGGHAAITTASDLMFGEALDEPPAGYRLGNPQHVKDAAAARLRGEAVKITVTESAASGSAHEIIHHPLVLAVGIGCERGTPAAEVKALVDQTLAAHQLSPLAVACHATIDVKEDEPAIRQFSDVRLFDAAALRAEAGRIASPSPVVEAEVGTPSVAEAAALAAAGEAAVLLVPKTKSKRATCAVARAEAPLLQPAGRPPGVLHVVGIGPGTPTLRSPSATAALLEATDWVGYGLYLDLVSDLRAGQQEHRFPLGEEEARCRHALSLAGQGRNVALVCSGDAAIYAMAALVYELADREPCRTAIEVHPGISAFQVASARAGALIGHDFCCISLSDLLTPWEAIERRIAAAAEGDFVIAFYNPRSLKRRDQIERAFAMLKPHRLPGTPVILASNLGRPDENVRTLRFDQFNSREVDMLTVVLVGSSQSRLLARGDGGTYAYTPRGYARKMDAP